MALDSKAASIMGASFVLGLTSLGFYGNKAVEHVHERFVQVKGLSEREVKSNLGVLSLNLKHVGNDLEKTSLESERDRTKVMAFLQEQGFSEHEINLSSMQVMDTFAKEHGDSVKPEFRYILQSSINVRSSNVDAVEKCAHAMNSIIKLGVPLEASMARYYFTTLDDLRPLMMAEATQSARKMAEQFAKDSHSRVGSIRNATQGHFRVLARDSEEEDHTSDALSTPYKKVRVVSTIEYILE